MKELSDFNFPQVYTILKTQGFWCIIAMYIFSLIFLLYVHVEFCSVLLSFICIAYISCMSQKAINRNLPVLWAESRPSLYSTGKRPCTRYVKFGIRIGLDWPPNGTNLGLFKISFSTFWLAK